MTFTSLTFLSDGVVRAVRRFPWVVGGAFFAWLVSCAQIHFDVGNVDDMLWRVLLPAALSVPLFFALTVIAERRGNMLSRLGWLGMGLGILLGYYVSSYYCTTTVYTYRFWQLIFAFHLIVAVIPYVGQSETPGFWQYNRLLFQRFVLGVIYSVVVYLGLCVALKACETLLGLRIPSRLFGYLWVTVTALFHPLYFLSGMPDRWEDLDALQNYPAPLRVLVQYILIPLVTVYLAILYAYMLKIGVLRSLPKGTIGWLVCGISTFGILTVLLAHPLRDTTTHGWVRGVTRWFYLALLPVVVLLAMALSQRVRQYGITENRYVLMILTVWIGGVAVWFTRYKDAPIKIVPMSLAILALITTVGPWGAYSVSLQSQKQRLEKMLIRTNILQNGLIVTATQDLAIEDRKEITALMDYVVGSYGVRPIQPWFKEDLKALDSKSFGRAGIWARRTQYYGAASREILVKMGIQPADDWQSANGPSNFQFQSVLTQQDAVKVKGFDYLVPVHLWVSTYQSLYHANIADKDIQLQMVGKENRLKLLQGGQELLGFALGPMLEALDASPSLQRVSFPISSMTVTATSPSWRGELRVSDVSGNGPVGQRQIVSVNGYVLLQAKQ